MSADNLSDLSKFKYITIETFRKNGAGVRTPIWFIIYQGLIYFRTDVNSGKVKRIRNNPHVRIAPCDIRGNLKGNWFDGKVKFADLAESSITHSMIDKKYGFITTLIRIFNKIRRTNPVVIAISI
jgi:PPOX class probable F420-dependent enzyme, Rv2061 family